MVFVFGGASSQLNPSYPFKHRQLYLVAFNVFLVHVPLLRHGLLVQESTGAAVLETMKVMKTCYFVENTATYI
jgi:hypothetical protein